MKKFGILLMLFCVLFSKFSVYAVNTDETIEESAGVQTSTGFTDSGVTGGIDAPGALLGTEKLVKNVRTAVLYEANSQTMLYSWNADTQMYPASFVKIMTALVAINEGNLTDIATVKQEVISVIPSDAISVKLVADELISIKDLLYCMIVTSANDAAIVIADHIAGSEQAFVEKMNSYSQEIGCTGTHFTNVTGLHNDNQHTTARDVARILDHAMKNETFCQMFTTTFYDVPKTNKSDERRLSSGNYMMDTKSQLYYDDRVIGGRAGVTQDGRRSMATVSEDNGMRIISVVMGSESVYQEDGYSAISIGGYKETTALLDLCYNGFKVADILYPNQALRQLPVSEGNCDVVIGPKESVLAVLPQSAKVEDLVFRYSDKAFSAPIENGMHISDVQVWVGASCVAQAKLYAMNQVGTVEKQEKIVENNTDGWKLGILIIGVIFACGAGVVALYRVRGHIQQGASKRTQSRNKIRRRRQ